VLNVVDEVRIDLSKDSKSLVERKDVEVEYGSEGSRRGNDEEVGLKGIEDLECECRRRDG
jgi:hypothetical protein